MDVNETQPGTNSGIGSSARVPQPSPTSPASNLPLASQDPQDPQALQDHQELEAASGFRNDYDYDDLDEPKVTTERKKSVRFQQQEAAVSDDDTSDRGSSYEPRIYQRHQPDLRAQLPDVRAPQLPDSDQTKPDSGLTEEESVLTGNADPNPIISCIDLNWTKKNGQLWLTWSENRPGNNHREARREVVWKHSHDTKLDLDKFEDLIKNEPRFFTETEQKITRRLLVNTRRDFERRHRGGFGNSLQPAVSRYDRRDPSAKTADKYATFINFPYLEVRHVRQFKKYWLFSFNDHPTDSILRYYFRLSKTVDQDRRQSISYLEEDGFKASLEAPDTFRHFKTENLTVCVPQFWALILGEGSLVTNGFIHFANVMGPKVRLGLPESEPPTEWNDNPIIRIFFSDQWGRENSLVFPLDQCDCFFGLLHKQGQILRFTVGSKFRGEDHPIFYQDTMMRINNDEWFRILFDRQHTEIHVRIGEDKAKKSQPSPQANKETQSNCADVAFKLRNFVLPLLEWRVVDEYGYEEDDDYDQKHGQSKRKQRAIRFLENACVNMPAPLTDSKAPRGSTVPILLEPFSSYCGKTYLETNERLQADASKSLPSEHADRCRDIIDSTYRLLNLFMDEEMSNAREASRYIWGAVFIIIDSPKVLTGKTLEILTKRINALWQLTEVLHAGVCRQYGRFTNRNNSDPRNRLSNGAILLKSMVQAFECIMQMYFELGKKILVARNEDSPVEIPNLDATLKEHLTRAQSRLRSAKNELIMECDGNVRMHGLGPSATPEGLLISFLDRLSRSVYDETSIDIVQLYNESLQRLARKLRTTPSRRVLRKINEIQEELAIVAEIFGEQDKVLVELKKAIDWKKYDIAPVIRRLNFEYEDVAIQRIRRRIQDRIDNFKELQKRAGQLSEQNVQVLETVQDDNNRVLFVFTIVTVLFLPASFISSYFGMNVHNLRSTTQTTTHFWVIAGPLTLGVLIPSLLFAYMGDTLIGLSSEYLHRRKK